MRQALYLAAFVSVVAGCVFLGLAELLEGATW